MFSHGILPRRRSTYSTAKTTWKAFFRILCKVQFLIHYSLFYATKDKTSFKLVFDKLLHLSSKHKCNPPLVWHSLYGIKPISLKTELGNLLGSAMEMINHLTGSSIHSYLLKLHKLTVRVLFWERTALTVYFSNFFACSYR